MNNVSGSSVVKGAAAYSLLQAVLSLCGAISALGLGAVGSNLGSLAGSADLTAEQQQAIAASGAASGLLSIFGIVFGIIGILMLVNAFGLFQRKPWAWTTTVGIFGLNVVLSVANWLTGSFNAVSLGTTLISAVIVYFFLTNAEVKAELGKS
jgi:hypothetical protein